MDLAVQQTRNGQGIVAMRDFAPEETLYEVMGEYLTCNEDDDVDESTRSNTFRFDEDLYISPAGSLGDFQNHSCTPNAKVVKRDGRLFIDAISDITHGEEVSIDYSTILGADDVWEMACNCGSTLCRGVVKSFDALPVTLKRKYEKEGIVPAFIVALSE